MKFEKDLPLFSRASDAWASLEAFRARRRRLKLFSYGRQWDDLVRLPDGALLREGDALLREGRVAITNNLLRRMIKSLIGRFRSQYDPVSSEDARALEEFIISGCAVQRLGEGPGDSGSNIVNYSVERLFFEPFQRPDASDCAFFGLLHDVALSQLIRRFSHGNVGRALALRRLQSRESPLSLTALEGAGAASFSQAGMRGAVRVIEVWRRAVVPFIRLHDPERGSASLLCFCSLALQSIDAENERRSSERRRPLRFMLDIEEAWEQTWLGPQGEVIEQRLMPASAPRPVVMRFYPMVDGEIHSALEEVVPQQKLINRLITVIDDVIASSAKGIVLYPSDQLPEGLTWEELRRLWSSPGSIVPFKRTSKTIMPREVMGNPSIDGAARLLDTQLRLFDQISGAPAVDSTDSRMSADALREHDMARAVATADLFSDFNEFRRARNRTLRLLGSSAPCSAPDPDIS